MDVSEILKYLYGDMPEKERLLFEQALNSDKELKYKFQLVKDLENDSVDEKTLSFVFKLEKIKRQYKLLCDQDPDYETSDSEIRMLIKEVDTIALLEEFISDKNGVNASDCIEPVLNKPSVRYPFKKILAAAAVVCFVFFTSLYYLHSGSGERVFSQNYEKYFPSKLRYLNPQTDVRYLYASGNFQGTVNLSAQIIKADPFNSIAHFYAGLSLLELKQYPRAIENLVFVAASDDKTFSYPAQWYLSLCYIKTEHINSSKEILYKLANSSSSVYSKKARDLLQYME